MDKRKLHHLWTKLRGVKPWYFLVVAAVSALVCVFALRANNLHMIKLRDAVYSADKAGADVQAPLQALQAYVTSHMNADPGAGQNGIYPPIQLKYTYERLVKAQADSYAQANSQLYSDAQKLCEQQNPTDFSGRNRVPCITDYVQSHGPAKPAAPSDALYKFAFASPRWSPDLAGWSLLVAVASGLLFTAFAVSRWLRSNL